jgi:hypothetical protein
MTQTTEQPRSRTGSKADNRARSAFGRKGTAGAQRPGVPAPPKRRRPALTALAVLLIVGGAALAGLLAVRMDSREPVLVVNQQIDVGEQITLEMLSSTNVSGDGLSAIPVDQADQIAGKLYARQTIYEGQLLQTELLRKTPPLEGDQAQVGVPLSSGKFPPGLRSGDAVRLVRIGDSQNASEALATGLVLEVAKTEAGAFGSSQKTSVATILVPAGVADEIVSATGTEELGMALTARGVGVDEAEIQDLSGGRN